MVVHLSVHSSVCLHKPNMKPITPKLISYKAHIWNKGTSHQYASPGTKVKVICKGQGQISGSCFQKMVVSGALVFHKRILFPIFYSVVGIIFFHVIRFHSSFLLGLLLQSVI